MAAQRKGADAPSYLRAAEVADILHVSPKTVSRWAKEGKLPFMKTLGGHRRYPEAGRSQRPELADFWLPSARTHSGLTFTVSEAPTNPRVLGPGPG